MIEIKEIKKTFWCNEYNIIFKVDNEGLNELLKYDKPQRILKNKIK